MLFLLFNLLKSPLNLRVTCLLFFYLQTECAAYQTCQFVSENDCMFVFTSTGSIKGSLEPEAYHSRQILSVSGLAEPD